MFLENFFRELNEIDFEISDIILFDDISNVDFADLTDLDGAYRQLKETVSTKYTLSKNDVQIILNKLKKCTVINSNDYYKTNKFLRKNDLTLNDCLEIIHKLTIYDYYANTKSINPDHLNNTLIIFEPELIELSNGKKFNNLIIYLKLDIDETTDDAVALVSIHNGTRNNLPYR